MCVYKRHSAAASLRVLRPSTTCEIVLIPRYYSEASDVDTHFQRPYLKRPTTCNFHAICTAKPPIHHILREEQNSRIQLNDRIYERGNSTPETCSKLLEAKLTPHSSSSSSSSCNNSWTSLECFMGYKAEKAGVFTFVLLHFCLVALCRKGRTRGVVVMDM